MPISVRCLLCLDKALDQMEKLSQQEQWTNQKLAIKKETLSINTAYEIHSSIIAKSDQEAAQLLGAELYKHMKMTHSNFDERTTQLMGQFAGFHLMKYFESKDDQSAFELEKEKIRDVLCEEVMMYSQAEDEDEEEVDVNIDEYEEKHEESEDDEEFIEATEKFISETAEVL